MKMQEMTPQRDTHNGRQIQFASQWEKKILQLFSSQWSHPTDFSTIDVTIN